MNNDLLKHNNFQTTTRTNEIFRMRKGFCYKKSFQDLKAENLFKLNYSNKITTNRVDQNLDVKARIGQVDI